MSWPAKQCDGDGCTAIVAGTVALCKECVARAEREDNDTHLYAERGVERLEHLLESDAAFKAWLDSHNQSD